MSKKERKIAIVAGARPNFIKVVPLCQELKRQKMKYFLVNTGQHFDKKMADNFFKEFKIKPDYSLKPSKISIKKQFADIMIGLEKIFTKEKPFLIVVVGDVNSTLAGALVTKKMGIKLAHIEAGLRSYNNKMPEETNRVLTDHMSDLLFVTIEEGVKNLKKEGIMKNVYFVGNIMIDTLKMFLPEAGHTKDIHPSEKEKFYFCTLHRPENVDNKKVFKEILDALEVMAKDYKIYLPLHPRTKKMAKKFGLIKRMRTIFTVLPPLSYQQSLFYQKNAQLVLTDSGGVQEETSFLGVPCLTLRTETERPVTVKLGTNTIGGVTKKSILDAYRKKDFKRKKVIIPFWDGRTAEKIIKIIKKVS